MRVLLIEDDRMIGSSLSTALRREGIVVDWVRNGADGAERCAPRAGAASGANRHSKISTTFFGKRQIAEASVSLLASFAAGIAKSKTAVRAAITQPWSNGQTEGQVNRLKMVKRQMFGRAKVDPLEARLIGAA
jgi:DNA-binding NtrC family response regulator